MVFFVFTVNNNLMKILTILNFKKIIDGLAYIHEEKKIVHADIKPKNILLTTELQVKIVSE